MNTFSAIWRKLRTSKKYREEFVAAHVKRAIPFQARAVMKAKGFSQQELARRANLSQGVVSRAVDPSNGNITLNTIIRGATIRYALAAVVVGIGHDGRIGGDFAAQNRMGRKVDAAEGMAGVGSHAAVCRAVGLLR